MTVGAPAGPAPRDRPPLRVLVVTVVHDPQDARIRHREIRALLDAGFSVTYAAPFTAYGRELPRDVRPLDLPGAVGRRRVAAVRGARALLRREAAQHDVVLLHDPDLLLAVAGTGLGRGHENGLPVVVWDVHEDTASALGMRGWLPRPLRPAVRGGVRLAEWWAERRLRLLLAERGYRERFRREHPWVPNSVLVPVDEPAPPGDDRIVYVGRLTRARGALELIELGRLLAPTVTVELVGNADAEVAAALEAAQLTGEIQWTGFLPNDEALGRLEGALAGLSLLHDEPNYAHSRPTKVMEYMAYGLPVVTTPNAASVELVEHHGCGIVVPFGDMDAAAAAVRRLRDDAGERRRMGSAGRRAARETMDWRRDGARFAEQLAAWVEEAGARPAGD